MDESKQATPAEQTVVRKRAAHRWWNFRVFIRKGVLYAFALSGTIFAVYVTGNIPDPGFSDATLFLLLRLLRYASLLLCALSLCALGFSVHRVVEYPRLRNVLGIGFYFFTGLVGAVLSMLNSFIVAAAGGNG
jgi:hypothetical protein